MPENTHFAPQKRATLALIVEALLFFASPATRSLKTKYPVATSKRSNSSQLRFEAGAQVFLLTNDIAPQDGDKCTRMHQNAPFPTKTTIL